MIQDRCYGKLRPDTAAVLNRLAYVTANPIRHRIVPSLDLLRDHAWSSLGEMIGRPAKTPLRAVA